MSDKQFVNGLSITKKEGQYGAFLKCGINFDEFCENNPINERGWINFTIFENKEGKPYAVIDTYEKQESKENENAVQYADEDIPF